MQGQIPLDKKQTLRLTQQDLCLRDYFSELVASGKSMPESRDETIAYFYSCGEPLDTIISRILGLAQSAPKDHFTFVNELFEDNPSLSQIYARQQDFDKAGRNHTHLFYGIADFFNNAFSLQLYAPHLSSPDAISFYTPCWGSKVHYSAEHEMLFFPSKGYDHLMPRIKQVLPQSKKSKDSFNVGNVSLEDLYMFVLGADKKKE